MSEEYITPRYRIEVDEEACGNAVECLKCVKVCLNHGPNCIGFVNKEAPDPDESLPKRFEDIGYRVFGAFLIGCDGCGQCAESCPKGALSVIAPEPQIPRALITQDGSVVLCGTLADGTKIVPEE